LPACWPKPESVRQDGEQDSRWALIGKREVVVFSFDVYRFFIPEICFSFATVQLLLNLQKLSL
jgi:hypothetical protein